MALIGVAAAALVSMTACAVAAIDQTPDVVDQAFDQANGQAPAASPPAGNYTDVPLPQGVSLWQSTTNAVVFAVQRSGDDVITARHGMSAPRCFFGTATDGVLQGRYRVITAGAGMDQQADPVRVSYRNGELGLIERATGADLGSYVAIDPAETAVTAQATAALDKCRDVRSAPATATPR
jgi:hypothetical protein